MPGFSHFMRERGCLRAKSGASHSNTYGAKQTLTLTAWPTPLWTMRPGPDHGSHPASRRTVTPIGTEDRGMAGRAEVGRENLLGNDSRPKQLFSRRAPTIKEQAVRTRRGSS